MVFAIDTFGGDNAPSAVIEGCILAMQKYPDFGLILTGDESVIRSELSKYKYDEPRVRIVHAPDTIGCDEQPTLAVRRKKDSSLVRALRLVADKEADCVISAGNTGALLAGATFIVKRIPGVKRPALAPVLPSLQGAVMLIDSGANADCKPEYLEQFAHMGAAYMQNVMGIESPRIGLINNGSEESKGNELTKSAYTLLKNALSLNFTGNCEPRDIMSGDHDVLVCDGFVGNAILKTMEGTFFTVFKMLKNELMGGTMSKLGAVMSKGAFKTLRSRLDYKEYGGAPLLGVRGGVIKAHGSSDAKAFESAIAQAYKLVSGGVTEKISAAIASTEPVEE